ncbi:MAG: CpsD/CapB family tyrosine-protein kinase [Bryobacterales bacterium]|nr:CpsD/CapB family tyrosine-protein kinase [Bryobacteraceae bacterium]MDW8129786.1 CpsD/CapB family tyrosine-protein kinase [Bryobacterales bacterium]
MSRVHDALRRAEQMMGTAGEPQATAGEVVQVAPTAELIPAAGFLERLDEVPFQPAEGALLLDLSHPHQPPNEEFRSLRTRLNHLQNLQPLHTLVVTSPSPAEGKSFVAANLAIAQAQLSGNLALLADFDLRRPVLHALFQIPRSPGITDYLLGNAPLEAVIKRVAGMNLCVMPAGSVVKNPLELINLRQTRELLRELPRIFHWVILDSPPLLFSADANLLGTMTDGTILVVRIGQTTIDMVARAMQSLCENNVVGVVVNAARAGELYSKYTYYYSSYGYRDREQGVEAGEGADKPAH